STHVNPAAPTDADATVNSVDEGAAVGSLVGITAAGDPDSPPVTFSLTDDAGGRFAIDPVTGVVTVAAGAVLDGPATLSITVQAHDAEGGTATATFPVAVRNVDVSYDAGGDETLTPAAAGTFARTVAFSDPGPDTWSGTVDYGDGSDPQPLAIDPVGK